MLLGCWLFTAACQTTPTPQPAKGDAVSQVKEAPNQKARSIGTARARQDCLYYSKTPDGKMALGGSLAAGTRVQVTARSEDGWSEVRLSNGQEASIPTEDLTSLSQYKRDRSRAANARRGKFKDPRPKIAPGSARGLESKLPTAPPPADFTPPPLPDSPGDDPLFDILLKDL